MFFNNRYDTLTYFLQNFQNILKIFMAKIKNRIFPLLFEYQYYTDDFDWN